MVTVRDITSNGASRVNHAALTDWLEITLQRQGENVSFVLEKNGNIRTDVPVSVYRNGRILYQDINDTQVQSFYTAVGYRLLFCQPSIHSCN